MAIYRMMVEGRKKPLLVRVGGKPEAIATIVTEAKALTAEEVEEALAAGEKVWKPGEPMPTEISGNVERLVHAAREMVGVLGSDNGAESEELRDAVNAFYATVPAAE